MSEKPDTKDTFELVVAGRKWTAWEEINVERSLDTLTGQFDLTLARREKTKSPPVPFDAGAPVQVKINNEVVMSGFIDRITPSIDSLSVSLQVSGRDKAADLVDCSAVHKPGSWSKADAKTIITDLAKPFGISVQFNGDMGKPLPKFALQPQESPFDAMERIARFRGFILYSMPDGSIAVGAPDAGAAMAHLVEGTNILTASAEHNISERFAEYIVKGQQAGNDTTNGRAASNQQASAKDPAITRPRTLIIVAEDQASKADLQKRADWEANVRAARAQSFDVTVKGWRPDAATAVWPINRSLKLTAPSLRVDSDLLIIATKFTRNSSGTTTTLTLQRRDAWTPQPLPANAKMSEL